MSASKETNKHQNQADKERSWGILYAVGGVVVAIVIVALLVYNSNFFQNRTSAVTINGQSYNSADVQYYYANARQYQALYAMYGMSTYDYSTAAKDQVYDQTTGETWHDYFLEQAVENLTQDVALADAAQQAGYTLSEDGQADVKSSLTSLESNWISSGYSNRSTYLRASYGSAMTYDKFVEILNRAALASEYANEQYNSYTYDENTLNSYYDENKDTLDTYDISQFVFQASVDTQTTDAEGNTVDLTDEEIAAALDEAKVEAEDNARQLFSELQAGEDPTALQEKYADSLYSSYVSDQRVGSSVNSSYSDWAFDSSRQAGDVTTVEYEGGSSSSYNYCVVLFGGRYQDNTPTANIRHILISAGSDPTDEEYEEAKAQAEELLAQWKADGATEDSFAQLATENSADTSSASNGGLISNVSESSTYVDAFKEWALDSSRKVGDTGIVQNTGSSVKGYHIMYFSGWDQPEWMLDAASTLRSQDYSAWQEELLSGYTAENGNGLKYVG